jgi:hypothetical protein
MFVRRQFDGIRIARAQLLGEVDLMIQEGGLGGCRRDNRHLKSASAFMLHWSKVWRQTYSVIVQ